MFLGKFRDPIDLFWGLYRRAYIALYWLLRGHLPTLRAPQVVELELTNACNMACPHCHRGQMGRSEGYMPLALFCKLVDEMKGWPFASLRIVGLGESGLHPQLPEMMGYLKGSGIKVEFTTNGELLNRYPPETICAWPIDLLGISIDGVDGASYIKLRPGGNYTQLSAVVERLHRHKRENGLRKPMTKVRNVILPGMAEAALQRFREHWLARADSVSFNTYNPPRARIPDEGPLSRCDELFFLAHVRWDGRVPLCAYQFLFTEQEFLGDLGKQSLAEIWQGPRLAEMRAIHLHRDFERASFCTQCFNTQCRSRIFANRRRFNTSNGRLATLINRVINIM